MECVVVDGDHTGKAGAWFGGATELDSGLSSGVMDIAVGPD